MPLAPIRDILMYYEEAGSGEPLLLIAGLGADLQTWRFQVADLSKSFRVITFDNRGAGRSSAPDRPYTISAMAADAVALLDHLGIAKANVVGWSMGGFIAQELAIEHPTRVSKLVLVATSATLDGQVRARIAGNMNIRRSNLSREQQARIDAPWLFSAALLDDADRYERSIQNGLSNPYAQQDHAYIRQCQAALNWEGTVDRAAKIACPTLVVAAREDIAIPARLTDQLAKLIPGATQLQLPGAHASCIEFPREYNAAFVDFLAVPVPA